MFSVPSLTCQAIWAMRSMPSAVNSTSRPSVASSAWYCLVSAAEGSVRMRLKSSGVRALSSTRIGRRPCSSGIRSEGSDRWKAPEAMKRMWSVFTMPYLVETVEPSISGSRSRCTPSRETSPPLDWPLPLATLSISSRKTMPFCSTESMARGLVSSSLTSLPASSSRSRAEASLAVTRRVSLFWLPMAEERLEGWWVLCVIHGNPAGLALLFAHAGEEAGELLGHLLHARRSHDVDAGALLGQLDIDLLVVELPLAQLLAEDLAGGAVLAGLLLLATGRWQQGIEDAILGGILGAVAHLLLGLLADQLDGGLGQVAHDGLHVAAHVAHLGELGGLHLDEGRPGQLGQAAGDLSLAHPGGADHQDVLGRHLLTQVAVELHAAPAVAQGDGHGALGVLLADDVLVQGVDDLAGGHLGHGAPQSVSRVTWWLVNTQMSPAISSDFSVISLAERSVFSSRARAAARA